MSDSERTLASNKRRRGVIRASMTRLDTRIVELEDKTELSPSDVTMAQRQLLKLDQLDAEFKTYHFAIIDVVEDDQQANEQDILDNHDDKMVSITSRIQGLIAAAASPAPSTAPPSVVTPSASQRLAKRLKRLDGNFRSMLEEIDSLTPESDACLLHQFEEQIADLKAQLSNVAHQILDLEVEDDELIEQESKLKKSIFSKSSKIRQLLLNQSKATSTHNTGVKLPKLDVPLFNGDITCWIAFWEQFSVSVHGRKELSNVEKLAYLKNAIKDGSAKRVVEGLSSSGDQYLEAIQCLKTRYERPPTNPPCTCAGNLGCSMHQRG